MTKVLYIIFVKQDKIWAFLVLSWMMYCISAEHLRIFLYDGRLKKMVKLLAEVRGVHSLGHWFISGLIKCRKVNEAACSEIFFNIWFNIWFIIGFNIRLNIGFNMRYNIGFYIWMNICSIFSSIFGSIFGSILGSIWGSILGPILGAPD